MNKARAPLIDAQAAAGWIEPLTQLVIRAGAAIVVEPLQNLADDYVGV